MGKFVYKFCWYKVYMKKLPQDRKFLPDIILCISPMGQRIECIPVLKIPRISTMEKLPYTRSKLWHGVYKYMLLWNCKHQCYTIEKRINVN